MPSPRIYPWWLRLYLGYFSTLLVLLGHSAAQVKAAPATVLVYSATAGFRHDSIPTAVNALKNLGPNVNVQFNATEDETVFQDAKLAGYDAIVFLSNTGEVLTQARKDALQAYLNKGGNFIGIHSATDCLNTTAFYGKEVGAFFDYHPDLQDATINVVDGTHPSTSMLPSQWRVRDEMYNFKSDPRSIGAVVDESSYTDTGVKNYDQGFPHPTAWYQEHGAGIESGGTAGRSFYTSLGHLNETWQDDTFLSHVMGGITWALQANTTRAFNSSGQVGNPAGASSATSSGAVSFTIR